MLSLCLPSLSTWFFPLRLVSFRFVPFRFVPLVPFHPAPFRSAPGHTHCLKKPVHHTKLYTCKEILISLFTVTTHGHHLPEESPMKKVMAISEV